MSEPLRNYDTATFYDVPLGIRFSSILLVLVALGIGLCALFCWIALAALSLNHGRSWTGLYLGVAGGVGLTASLVCFRAAAALRSELRWGANVATVFGGITVLSGSILVIDFFHAGLPSADEYFLYPVAPIILLIGVWLCIYLNVPYVRSRFNQH